ncbi:hypothetical protein [Microbacterium candidum]|uniref:DinB family protein n=1 Tax=Microbacterium candidum TaxID=3041922 RepID=A0ABT7MWX7_9MICO|nr:hypothetical protein [Microbacterium sp. ASV49]MDL9978949.1 hypothetical protein [Microbacterium sp. ASV49]
MNDLLRRRFARANRLYLDLVDALTPELLASRLPGLPSDAIGHQLWCVLGARESYPAAARAGQWQGFTSPVARDASADAASLRAAFEATAADVDLWVAEIGPDDEESLTYALALLEHETMHQGQLIRYQYGLGIARPHSWQQQYALDEDF